jgi:hypothetical protein
MQDMSSVGKFHSIISWAHTIGTLSCPTRQVCDRLHDGRIADDVATAFGGKAAASPIRRRGG